MSTETRRSSSKQIQFMVLCAILIALSIGLNQIKFLKLPLGGSVTLFSMLAGTLCGYFCGPRWGLLSGFALGLLNIAIGGYVIHPVQVLLDYILAFTAFGVSGFFNKQKNGLITGYIVAILLKWFFHFLSGFIFFKEYTPDGWNPIAYSAVYNIISIGVEGIMTIVLLILTKKVFENLKNKFIA